MSDKYQMMEELEARIQAVAARERWCKLFLAGAEFLLVLAFIFLAFESARAEPLKGLDLLGLAKMDAKMIGEEIDNGTAIGVLDSTFGDPYPKMAQLVSTGKVSAYRVHLRDYTCFRGNRCPKGYPGASDERAMRGAIDRLSAFAKGVSSTSCYVSPALEHDVKSKEVVNRWYKLLDERLPNCTPVCSAFTGWCPDKTPNGRKILRERHGNSVRADSVSNDGESIFDANIPEYQKSATTLLWAWDFCANGRVSGEKTFTPPMQRKKFCSRADIREQVLLLRPYQPPPIIAGCSLLKKPELYKTHAEKYEGVGDGRGGKGLLISSKRFDKVMIHTLSGKAVGYLKYYGPFDGGGYREYVGSGSGQSPLELVQALGGLWGTLRAGGHCRVFSPVYRQGYFR